MSDAGYRIVCWLVSLIIMPRCQGRVDTICAMRIVPKPIIPGTTTGYSGTPLPKKLGIKTGTAVILVNAPARFERQLEPLPEGASFVKDAASARVAVLFAGSQAELARDFRGIAKALPEKSALWIAWPKKASGLKTDLSDERVREFGLGAGWMDSKVCAIDERWSGLCFARRK